MTKVAAISATPDLSGTPSNAPVPSAAPAAPVKAADPSAADRIVDYRLVIEEDPVTGSFIYKTLDRRTGEVVNQFPREQLLRLRDSEAYSPGKVFNSQS
jgi:flagellar protein FlaG